MNAAATVVVVLLLLMVVGLLALERGTGGGPKELALVATLGAVAAAGRVLFAPIPGVQPVTFTCLVTGAALGPRAGLAVGPIAGLLSNSFLGQGPWTPAQMALWSLVGLTGAALRPVCRNRWGLAAVGIAWGFAYGWGMNAWDLASFGPDLSWASMTLYGARSAAFDLAHGLGTAALALLAGPAVLRLLRRYALRVRTEVVSPPPAPAPAPAGPRPPGPPAPARPR